MNFQYNPFDISGAKLMFKTCVTNAIKLSISINVNPSQTALNEISNLHPINTLWRSDHLPCSEDSKENHGISCEHRPPSWKKTSMISDEWQQSIWSSEHWVSSSIRLISPFFYVYILLIGCLGDNFSFFNRVYESVKKRRKKETSVIYLLVLNTSMSY